LSAATQSRARTPWTGLIAVVLAALTMGMAFAHTLELPQKLGWDAATWTRVMHSLYAYFAIVGGPVEVAAVIASVVFAIRNRGRPGGGLATVGAACFVIALVYWFAVVNTANSVIGKWTVDAVPPDWERWRLQWEFGHAGHFVLTFAGFLLLLQATVHAAVAAGEKAAIGAPEVGSTGTATGHRAQARDRVPSTAQKADLAHNQPTR
jgi:Domain of unknown function (DUF1772)